MGISASKVIVFGLWTGSRTRWLKQPKTPVMNANPGMTDGIFGDARMVVATSMMQKEDVKPSSSAEERKCTESSTSIEMWCHSFNHAEKRGIKRRKERGQSLKVTTDGGADTTWKERRRGDRWRGCQEEPSIQRRATTGQRGRNETLAETEDNMRTAGKRYKEDVHAGKERQERIHWTAEDFAHGHVQLDIILCYIDDIVIRINQMFNVIIRSVHFSFFSFTDNISLARESHQQLSCCGFQWDCPSMTKNPSRKLQEVFVLIIPQVIPERIHFRKWEVVVCRRRRGVKFTNWQSWFNWTWR